MTRKKTEEKREIHEHHHYAPNWKGLVKIVLIFITVFVILITMVGWVDFIINEDKEIYRECVNACSQKHFIGENLGVDARHKYTVQEFDRTECIKSCNDMLIALKVNKIYGGNRK